MRIPVPANRLVALTLVGALLTGVLSVGLMSPTVFSSGEQPSDSLSANPSLSENAPTPNADFTPAVQQQSGYEEHEEHEEYEEYEEYEADDDHDDAD